MAETAPGSSPVMSTFRMIYDPRKAYRELIQHWRWGHAFWIVTLVGVLAWFQEIPAGLHTIEVQLQALQEQGAEIVAGMPEAMRVSTVVSIVVTTLVTPVTSFAFTALLLWFVELFNPRQLGFGRLFCLTAWAMAIPMALHKVVAVAFSLGGVAFRSDLGVLFPEMGNGLLLWTLQALDAFQIWILYLLVVGLAETKQASTSELRWTVAVLFLIGLASTILVRTLRS